ncbi:MAG TPA: hypothetical protein V6D28_17900 [Leptolyngbyaceae cyanobacterium]
MYYQTAYGLGIQSELPLPALVSGATTVDVVVKMGKVDRTVSEIASPSNFLLRASQEEACFYCEKVGAFLVKNGREIIVDANLGVDERVLSHFLVGLPLAMLLHQRGLLILHGSAVAINGAVVAFVGRSGAGKSTIAATFHRDNYPIVTDDILAVDINISGNIRVIPSYPQLRLWPETINFLGEVPENLPQVYPKAEKRAKTLNSQFQLTPLPLQGIYVLDRGNDREIEVLKPQAAFLEIARQCYPNFDLLTAIGTSEFKFQQCIKLARRLRVCRLKRPRDLSSLPELTKLVEADILSSKNDKAQLVRQAITTELGCI